MRWHALTLALTMIGCSPGTSEPISDAGTGAADAGSGSSGAGMTGGSSGNADGLDDGGDESTGAMRIPDVPGSSGDSSGGVTDGPFVTTTFEIPAGTVVQEFSFSADADSVPGILDGRNLVVAVRDLTHPDRDQDTLCPNNHPLDGCATVDYGAFGNTHDNHITFEGPDTPVVHLYKDRSLQPEAESLPSSE